MSTATEPIASKPGAVMLDGTPVSSEMVDQVARRRTQWSLSPVVEQRVAAARRKLERAVDDQRLIYGVTTGYGPLANRHISPQHSTELQRNLIYHLASGVGEPLTLRQTRALMAARISSLAQGASAIRPSSLQLLIDCLNADVVPVVPRLGTVGASGDLTPLAHVALGLLGEGEAFYRGQRLPAAEALQRAGLQALAPTHKEGLALVNGTSAMTGIAALNTCDARRALDLSLRSTVLYAEVLGGRRDAWHEGLALVRPHPGQLQITRELQAHVRQAPRLRTSSGQHVTRSADEHGVACQTEALQDPYSIRCAPQILGAVADVLSFHERIVETELNAVTDNPVFFGDEILHGGNFYGQHVAFASDALLTAVVKLGVYAERRIARLTDENQSRGLPAFLQPRQTGLQSGFMGAQVTATALVAEMRSKAVPASIQSIPTNANNQDVVSLGTIAARKVGEVLDHLFDLLAIEAMMLAQAYELRGGAKAEPVFSRKSWEFVEQIRLHVATLANDRPLAPDIARLSAALRQP